MEHRNIFRPDRAEAAEEAVVSEAYRRLQAKAYQPLGILALSLLKKFQKITISKTIKSQGLGWSRVTFEGQTYAFDQNQINQRQK